MKTKFILLMFILNGIIFYFSNCIRFTLYPKFTITQSKENISVTEANKLQLDVRPNINITKVTTSNELIEGHWWYVTHTLSNTKSIYNDTPCNCN